MLILKIFTIILFLLNIIAIILGLTTIQIDLKKFKYNIESKKNKKIEDYLVYIKFKFLKKITYFKIKIDDDKILKFSKNTKLLERIKKLTNRIIKKEVIKSLDNPNIKLLYIDLKIKIGLIENSITALSIGIISSLISYLVARKSNKVKKENYKYEVIPIYEEKLQLVADFKCIIDVKLVHIINIIYILLVKKGAKENGGTSDRSNYVFSND